MNEPAFNVGMCACCDIYGEGSWISCRPRQDFQNKPQTVCEREEKLMGNFNDPQGVDSLGAKRTPVLQENNRTA